MARKRHGATSLVVAALVLISLTSACSKSKATGASTDNTLTFAAAGGSYQDALKAAWEVPFTAQTGIKVVNDSPEDMAKVKTMVEAGKVTWDLIDDSSGAAIQYCGKYLEKLDFSVINRNAYAAGTVGDCGVPYGYGSLLFTYNTKKYASNPPTTIADFFDVKRFPGHRIIFHDFYIGVLEDALIADGVPPDQLYPLDIDRALRKLDTIKNVTTFAATNSQVEQAMIDGTADMALTGQARALHALQAKAPWTVVWDKVIVSWTDLLIPKGAPHKNAAMRFIAFTAQDAQQKALAQLTMQYPTNPNVKPNYDATQQKLDVFAPEHKNTVVLQNAEWWAQNIDDVTKKYTTFLAG